MGYPFPSIEHKVYNKTFLRDVRVSIEFNEMDFSTIEKKDFEHFFCQFSGANVDIEKFYQDKTVTILSEYRDLEFKFDTQKAEVKICTPLYSSFDAAMSYWQVITKYLKTLKVSEVCKLLVRKYSALYFQTSAVEYDIRKVMEEVFCKDLMKNFSGSYKDLNSIEKNWTKDDEETGTIFNAVYGIKKSDSVDKEDRLTLITSVESKNKVFDVSDVLNVAGQYSKMLFDAFHWCVKEDIIREMNK